MPTIDDVYGLPAMVKPAAIIPPPAAQKPKETAIERFSGGDLGPALKADALDLISVKVRPVDTAEAAAALADRRARVKLLLKDIEHRRKQVVEPIKREAAAVDAEARRWTEPLQAWDKDAEKALLAFQKFEADKRRRQEEARQRAVIEAAEKQRQAEQAGDVEAAETASLEIMRAEAAPEQAPVTGFKTDAGTTSLRKCWKVEVVDVALVPPAYLVPDLKKLQAAVDAGAREIEGCHIFEDESLPVRTRA